MLGEIKYFEDLFKLRMHQQFAIGQFSEYYQMPEKEMSKQLLCAGIETRQPIFWFDKNRMVATFDIEKNFVDGDMLCDSKSMMEDLDPRLIDAYDNEEV